MNACRIEVEVPRGSAHQEGKMSILHVRVTLTPSSSLMTKVW